MLTRLHVRGYKALQDLSATFAPLTVVAGPNGCGKSSMLEAITMVRDFVTHQETARDAHPFEELRSRREGASAAIAAELRIRLGEHDQDKIRAALDKLPAASGSRLPPTHRYDGDTETRTGVHGLRAWLEYGPGELSVAAKIVPAFPGNEVQQEIVDSCLGQIRMLELDVSVLGRPSYLPETIPRMSSDGSGLATVLSWLQGEQYEKFEEIQEQLRKFVPEVERIRTRRAPVNFIESRPVTVGRDEAGQDIRETRPYLQEVIGSQIVFDFDYAKGIPAHHVSDGTLRLLGLLTVVLTDDVSVLLLDDVDQGLHPRAQEQLSEYLRSVALSGIQVIATTHSSDMLRHLDYEEIRTMGMTSKGARMGRLADHPQFAAKRNEMHPGEFWMSFGEDWLEP